MFYNLLCHYERLTQRRKTQIALAYVYWLQQTYPTISVFWVHAINAERFRQSFATIAEEYQIPGYTDPKVDVLVLVKVWLEKNDGRQWLMVLDNADDLHLFFPPPTESTSNSTESGRSGSLSDYLPECAHGALLFTTRNKQLGVKLSRSQCVIEVGRMSEDESEHLLRSKTVNATPADLLSLSARLEYLPLALVQAAAYIQEMSITVAKYLVLLGDTDQNMIHLLSKEFETVGRDSKAPRAVAKTWILSFQQIEQQQVLASELLSFMSLLDRQDIPARFLSYYIQRKEHEEPASEMKLVEALGVLKAFSFVTENNNGSFDMHRLVHLVTRKWLTGCSRLDRFGKEVLLMMSHLYPFGTYKTRTTCGLYLSHANAVLQASKFTSKDEAEAKASLLNSMGGYFIFEGKWGDAEAANIEATRIRRELFGHSHPDTLMSMNNLAYTFWNQGRLKEAEELLVQVMETHKMKLGEDHPDTLMSMNNLAWTFWNQDRWEEAEELLVQVMETRKMRLGEDHPYTLKSMNNLALTFGKQGRWEEAEELEVQVMETRKMRLGEDHPNTLISMSNLALTFWNQGRWEEAEELQVQVMETRKIKLGEDHPDTLMSMNNLAHSWKSMGKTPEAIDLMRRCTRLRRVKFGLHHPHTKSSTFTLDTWENES
jgi:tetratricopeptide (TPR) repeat protein